MDIQSVANKLMGYLGNNPDLISQFVEHPYSTTAAAAGTDERISKNDMSQILTQVAAQSTGQSMGMGDITSIASTLLGQNNGSVHNLASALFGGAGAAAPAASSSAPSMVDIAAKSLLGGIAARGVASLLTGALGANKTTK
jgi:hypothetical protein